MYYALLHRFSTSDSYLAYYPRFFEMRPEEQLTNDYIGVGFSFAHLWFIIFLFVIAMIVIPLLLGLKEARGQRMISGLSGFFERRGTILLPALVFPLISEFPDVIGKPFIAYLVLFVFGFLLASDRRFHRGLYRNKETAPILGVISMSVMYVVWISGMSLVDDSLEDTLFHFVRDMNLWFWLVAILGYGQKYLNAENRVLQYARDAAYPFYLLHQTVIVAIGYYAVQWSLDASLKYFAIVAMALVITIALYDILVRRTNVTRFLFGVKPKARTPASGVARPLPDAAR